MFVYNVCVADARVAREAGSLARAGYRVTVFAVLDKNTSPREERDGFTIVRIDRNPIHYRILRLAVRVRRVVRLGSARIKRRTKRVLRLGRARARTICLLIRSAWRRTRIPWYLRRVGITHAAAPERPHHELRSRRAVLRWPIRLAKALIALPVLALRAMWRLLRGAGRSLAGLPRRTLLRVHKPLMFADYYMRSFRAARELGASVFHAHDVITLPVAAWLARRTGGSLLYDAHELYTEMSTLSARERRIWRFIEQRLIRRADVVVTVCESISRELSDRYRVARPSVLLNVPVLDDVDRPVAGALRRKVSPLAGDRPIVLYQGGFSPHRGLANLVDAVAMLDRCLLVLMGAGPLEESLRERILDSGLERSITIVPAVPQRQLLAHTRDATVGVIPYEFVGLNNYYTTPNKLFEYLAAGVPIAASDFPELRRFIGTYDVGVTFDPARPSDIARAIEQILSDHDALIERRANALRAARSLNWDVEKLKLLEIYGSLTGRPVLWPHDESRGTTKAVAASGIR
jgi:glycosyltransferase involved in cell wall biosynthesis